MDIVKKYRNCCDILKISCTLNWCSNTKLEIRPYTAGTYKIYLVEGGVQVSPEVELNLSAEPRQYVHFEFFKQEQQ